MSSIAYVTDEKMIEYHRLCGSRDISFWRLSPRGGFSDFKKGDLLFFYAHGINRRKKKGLVGYGHFDSFHTLSLKEMWKKFEKKNGYDSMEEMKEAIERAARNHEVPEKMSCLYLTDIVFFMDPVYPKDVGITINEKLESYVYLDKEDPTTTIRILQKADQIGVDYWLASQTEERENIFHKDEVAAVLSLVHRMSGKQTYSALETKKAKALTSITAKNGYTRIKGSEYEFYKMDGDTLRILVPFVSTTKNAANRQIELFGRLAFYRLQLKKENTHVEHVTFEVLKEEENTVVDAFVEELNRI